MTDINVVIFGTASMTARRITTEEEAKAALAERRRRAREELERQAELEKQRYPFLPWRELPLLYREHLSDDIVTVP